MYAYTNDVLCIYDNKPRKNWEHAILLCVRKVIGLSLFEPINSIESFKLSEQFKQYMMCSRRGKRLLPKRTADHTARL